MTDDFSADRGDRAETAGRDEKGGLGRGAETAGREEKGGLGRGILTAVLAAVITSILAYAGNFFSDGGLIRFLGGLSVSHITEAKEQQAHTNCGDTNEVVLAEGKDVKKVFCSLTDISIRQGNSIEAGAKGAWAVQGNAIDVANKDGWDVCKIDIGEGVNSGKIMLIAKMDGKCPLVPSGKGPEISCKAKCIRF